VVYNKQLSRIINLENVTIIDYKIIFKILNGMLKILFPNKNWKENELRETFEFCIGYREMLCEWLHKMSPGEIESKKLFLIYDEIFILFH